MGKQPTTGQKKTKEAIAKAAAQKKSAGHKKWNKGKVKEKVQHAVFIKPQTFDSMMKSIPKLGKHISVSHVVEKYKVVGSVARKLLRKLAERGDIKIAESHSKQALYYPAVAIVEKTEQKQDPKKQKQQKEKKKKQKQN